LMIASLLCQAQAVIRHPSTVYRPSHTMTNKVLTHGSRLHGERTLPS
jgi:hypothetical protein